MRKAPVLQTQETPIPIKHSIYWLDTFIYALSKYQSSIGWLLTYRCWPDCLNRCSCTHTIVPPTGVALVHKSTKFLRCLWISFLTDTLERQDPPSLRKNMLCSLKELERLHCNTTYMYIYVLYWYVYMYSKDRSGVFQHIHKYSLKDFCEQD